MEHQASDNSPLETSGNNLVKSGAQIGLMNNKITKQSSTASRPSEISASNQKIANNPTNQIQEICPVRSNSKNENEMNGYLKGDIERRRVRQSR